MKIETDTKLIVCMLPQGKGVGLIERLSKEKGIQSANVSTGRGRGAGAVGSIGAWAEVDTLAVTVTPERADEIFDFIYEAGALGQPRGGRMYQHARGPATAFTLPEIEEAEAD